MSEPIGRFCIAFDDPSLFWDCEWTRIDDPDAYPNLVTSYTIDRGRQYELDRTDTGRATVSIADRDGILDPTNEEGPFFTKIQPLLQAAIARYNPVTHDWWTRFRGFIEDYDYVLDPSQQVNRLVVTLVDLFEILAAIEMVPGPDGDPIFGDDPEVVNPDAKGQIVFANEMFQDRIKGVLTNAGVTDHYWAVFDAAVELCTAVYSPGESVMTVIQEGCDGEFPAVSNAYVDRFGRLSVHGRQAKFDPATTAATAGLSWDWHHWHTGDGAACAADPLLAHIRRFAYNRGLGKIINSALATPQYKLNEDGTKQIQVDDQDIHTNVAQDVDSIGKYGIRSWTAQNLQTLVDHNDDSGSMIETQRFAAYYVTNYAEPRNRVTDIAFRTMRPDHPNAGPTWELMSQVDISHLLNVNVTFPGGGGFEGPHFVEGVHEQVQPLTPGYDDVTVSLDLSPQSYFNDTSMFPPPPG